MLRNIIAKPQPDFSMIVRSLSDSSRGTKRFMQTVPLTANSISYIPYKFDGQQASSSTASTSSSQSQQNSWKGHTLPSRSFKDIIGRKSKPIQHTKTAQPLQKTEQTQTSQTASIPSITVNSTAPTPTPSVPKKKARRALRPRKALISLTPNAISHLQALLDQPEPQLIRIGVRNRGCSGLSYNLEYISEPQKFDEVIEQDGVKVVIDSKALFSIVGSEMDWLDDKISSRFVFKNPNSKGTCGCGESFMV